MHDTGKILYLYERKNQSIEKATIIIINKVLREIVDEINHDKLGKRR